MVRGYLKYMHMYDGQINYRVMVNLGCAHEPSRWKANTSHKQAVLIGARWFPFAAYNLP
jgi:hypothetical protein